MPKTQVMQTSFTTGVISPSVMGRVDVAKYYNALAVADNVTIMPHGGIKRRAGTVPVLKSDDMSLGYVDQELKFVEKPRLESFVFNIRQKYLVAFDKNTITIIKGTLKIHDITTSAVHDFTAQQLKDMDIVQYADTMIIVHPDFEPMKLVRGLTETDWTLSVIKFNNIPLFDYTNNYLGQKEIFIGDGKTKEFVLIYTKPPFTMVSNAGSPNPSYNKDIGKIVFASAPQVGEIIQIISGRGVPEMFSSHSYEDIWSFSKGYPVTVAIHQGRLYFGGTKSKPITVFGSVINDFFDFNLGDGEADMGIFATIASGSFDNITNITAGRTLQVFTDSGEYYTNANPVTPATIGFRRQTAYGARRTNMVELDGTTIFVDRSGHAVRKFIYSNEEDGYISPLVSLLSDHLFNDIQRIAVSRGSGHDIANLVYVVNADGSMAVLSTMRTEDIEGWSRWTTAGRYLDVRVVDEDVYLLIDRGGQIFIEKLQEGIFMDHYTRQGQGTDKFIGDGVRATFILNNSTNGKFLAYIDGVEAITQPSYDNATNSVTFVTAPELDAWVTIIPTDLSSSSITLPTSAGKDWDFMHKKGNFFYEGKGRPYVDGKFLKLDYVAGHHLLEAGFNYHVRVLSVDLNIATKTGAIINQRKRLVRVKLNLLETLGIIVEDDRIADRVFVMSFNHQLVPFTGVKEVYLLGYADHHRIEIKQDVPMPFTLLQIETEIKY